MEKIKSILSPGKQTDDQTMYGSTDSPDRLRGLGGEGSHFEHAGNARQDQVEATQQSRQSEPYGQSNTTSTTQQPMPSQDPSASQRNDYRQDMSDQSRGYNQNQTTDQSRGMDGRQHMPGRYPTGDSLKDQGVHNPYTSHDLDPRIGGSTGQSSTQEYSDNRNQQTLGYNDQDRSYQTNPAQSQTQTQRQGLKGLNVARTEDYSQDGPSAVPGSEHHGRNAAVGGGAIGAAGAGMAMKHQHDQDSSRIPESTTRANEYSGTTSSGNNNNYYGAPSGTAVSGSPQGNLYTTGGPGYDTTQTGQQHPYDSINRGQQGGYINEQYPADTQGGQKTYADDNYDKKESHKLRNTAIGAGAAGVGAHDQNTTTSKHDADTTRNIDGQDRFYSEQNELGHHGGVAKTEIAGTGAAQAGTREKPYTGHEPTHGVHERTGLDNPAYNKNKIDHAPISGQPIPGDGIELPRGNQYNHPPNDPRYGLPLHQAGVTADEAETLRAHDDNLMAKHEAKASKLHGKDTTHDTTTHEKKPRRKSLLEFLHLDKNKKYSKEEEEEFARQEREHNARSGLTDVGVAGAGAGVVAGAGTAGSHHGNTAGLETNKPLPHPSNQQTQGKYTGDGQQMNLTDRTRQQGTTNVPGYTGGTVDRHGDQIDERSGYDNRNEIPVAQYAAGNTGITDNRGDTLGSIYPGDGRDYPAGQSSTSTGGQDYNDNSAGGMSSKVLERDNGHKVLHKKGHLIHPGQDAETAARQ